MAASGLREIVERHFAAAGDEAVAETAIPGLVLMRATGNAVPRKARLYRPSLCLVIQGAKEMILGEKVFTYHEMQALVVSLEVPGSGRIVEASEERPYLAISLELDSGLMAEMLAELRLEASGPAEPGLGLFVADVDATLAGAFERLLRLLATPEALPILGRQTLREIYYWLLSGPNGRAIARLSSPEGHAQRIGRAVKLLRDNFTQRLQVAELARAANMSPSSFHQHFKALTNLSPLQYQKQLRLIEARRLIVGDESGVAAAAYRVGYESPSQFSREYARLFGSPPRRHASELRREAV